MELNWSLKELYSSFESSEFKNDLERVDKLIQGYNLWSDEITKDKRYSIYDILMEIEYKLGVLFDFHPMTTGELERNPIYFEEVKNNGVYYAGSW